MSTIQDYIRNLATTYQEPGRVSELTEKDLLADIALRKSMSGCFGELRCGISELHDYHSHPDLYIDLALGEPGSRMRVIYGTLATRLHHLIQAFQKPKLQKPEQCSLFDPCCGYRRDPNVKCPVR